MFCVSGDASSAIPWDNNGELELRKAGKKTREVIELASAHVWKIRFYVAIIHIPKRQKQREVGTQEEEATWGNLYGNSSLNTRRRSNLGKSLREFQPL